jgi:hypothetical protein
MRFNVEFTPEPGIGSVPIQCEPAINHVRPAFIENKRYRTKRGPIGDVVNRNAISVYQTD